MKYKLIWLMVFALLVCYAPSWARDLKLAENARDRKDYITAIQIWRELAGQNNATALAALGRAYIFGEGVPVDDVKAMAYLRKSVEQGDSLGQLGVAFMLINGRGGPKDDAQAAAWYKKAAEQGNAIAQGALGYLYQNGLGVAKDLELAVHWYRKAADHGDTDAQLNLGSIYQNGLAVAKDLGQAVHWYRKAAEQGNAIAQTNLGYLYQNGLGVSKDLEQAANWYQKATEQGNAIAQTSLGYLYQNGLGVSKDLELAVHWYRKAAEHGNANAQLNLGVLYQNGTEVSKDLEQAANWYQKAAEQGNVDAQVNLGNLYHNGLGVSKDLDQAANWYQKAAEQGNAIAQTNLGYLYQNGLGVSKDLGQAVHWYRKAAAQGNAIAQTNLGYLYQHGLEVSKDLEQAVHWYRKAADQGNADAQVNLGNLYHNGLGVSKDLDQAANWYQKAAEQGNAIAQTNLGYLYQNGLGVSKDLGQAVHWYRKAAAQGNAIAQTNLGYLYQHGLEVSKDLEQAVHWYRKAADQGNADAQLNLGNLYSDGLGVLKDFENAVHWYQKAAEQGNAIAQANLGNLYLVGRGIPQDLVEAGRWYRRAADQGNAYAQAALGNLYHHGLGVSKDLTEALLWYRRAADQGNAYAQSNLGNLHQNGSGVAKDLEQAAHWYQKAAEQGNAIAQTNLGYLYQNGLGVSKDLGQAVHWYRKAAEKGLVAAQISLGQLYLSGAGVEKNEAIAVDWLKKAANQENLFAQSYMGLMYELGRGVERDLNLANGWYEKVERQFNKINDSSNRVKSASVVGSNNDIDVGGVEKVLLNFLDDQARASANAVKSSRKEISDFINSSDDYKPILAVLSRRHQPFAKFITSGKNDEQLIALAKAALPKFVEAVKAESQLTPYARTWASLMQIALRGRLNPSTDELQDLDRESFLLDSALVEKYPPSHFFHIDAISRFWVREFQKYATTRDLKGQEEISKKLEGYTSLLSDRKAIAVRALVYTSEQVSFAKSYCKAAGYAIQNVPVFHRAPADKRQAGKNQAKAYRELLGQIEYCREVSPVDFLLIEMDYSEALILAGEPKKAFELHEKSAKIFREFLPEVSERMGLTEQSLERGLAGRRGRHLLSIGDHKGAFVEFSRELYSDRNKNGPPFGHSIASALIGLGDADGAISVLTPELAWYESDSIQMYCLTASKLREAFKAKGALNEAIIIQKKCIERILSATKQESLFAAMFFQELSADLEEEGRLAEAQQVLDMLKEDEQFDFIRRSSNADPRRTRIGFTATEAQWMSRYRAIADQLSALGKEEQALQKQAKLGLSEEQKRRQATLAADLKVAKTAFESFLNQMRQEFAAKGPSRAVEFTESSVKSLAELQGLLKSLGDDVVLLHVYLTDERVNFLLTTPGVQLARHVKIKTQDLNRQVFELNRLLRERKSDALPAAQALYKLLLAPVAQDLEQAGAKTVMLSLDGVLRYLPFGVLHDGQRYALQRWSLPIYTSVVRERLRDSATPNWQAAGLGVTRKHGNFDPLPAVRAEMNSIIRTGATGVLPGEVHLDEAFTAQRLKDVSQRRFPVVHVASHFQFSPGTEVNSFLLLGDGNQLTLGDIRTQNYRFDDVDLLTLSACETGLGGGRDQSGREIEGFGVIAQQQGAKAVLATLWNVADSSTAKLMGDMYRRRVQGNLSKIEALRQAQIALAAQPQTSHPFFWAPFILMGNWK